jgi:predicted metalloprotease
MSRSAGRIVETPALALSACLVAFGCGGPSTGPDDADLDADGFLNDADDCPSAMETVNGVQDFDGCPDTPHGFYLSMRSDVEAFWTGNHPQTFSRLYAQLGSFGDYTPPFDTPCGVLGLDDAMYCHNPPAVYYDLDLLASLHDSFGEVGPAFVISHEIGHNVSWGLGYPPLITPKQNELQADCFAGAWAADADDRLFQDDLGVAVDHLLAVSDPSRPWFDPWEHGTAGERRAAFARGYDDGPVGCIGQSFLDAFP